MNGILFSLNKKGNPVTGYNLEAIMLTEISQSQKDKYCMMPLYEVTKVVKFTETESRVVVTKGWV